MALKEDEDIETSPVWDQAQQALLNDLIDAVVSQGTSTALFKSQQIDDPEISNKDKREIAQTLLFQSPTAFLARFGPSLNENHLLLIETLKNESNGYNIDFQIRELRRVMSNEARRKQIKNRRFEALKRLEQEGKYFSEEEMQNREPLLYHQLVGQFLTENEKLNRYKEANKDAVPTFSKFLMRHAEDTALEDRLREQLAREAAEADSSEDEELENPQPGTSREELPPTRWGADWEDEEKARKRKENKWKRKAKKIKITETEKKLLIEEFRTHLHTKFLDGLDADFDYSAVDSSADFDCLQVRAQDEEEKYFDEETCDISVCTDTGLDDY